MEVDHHRNEGIEEGRELAKTNQGYSSLGNLCRTRQKYLDLLRTLLLEVLDHNNKLFDGTIYGVVVEQ